jgi:hypothetical protein
MAGKLTATRAASHNGYRSLYRQICRQEVRILGYVLQLAFDSLAGVFFTYEKYLTNQFDKQVGPNLWGGNTQSKPSSQIRQRSVQQELLVLLPSDINMKATVLIH